MDQRFLIATPTSSTTPENIVQNESSINQPPGIAFVQRFLHLTIQLIPIHRQQKPWREIRKNNEEIIKKAIVKK